MAWIIAVAIVIILAYKFPKSRRPLLIAGVFVFACIAYSIYNKHVEEKAAKARIQKKEIELVNLQLKAQNENGLYKLTGKIKNNSKIYNLSELKLKARINEFHQGNKNEIIGEEIAVISCNIPPMQSRYIEENMYLSELSSVKGTQLFGWQFDILETKGTE